MLPGNGRPNANLRTVKPDVGQNGKGHMLVGLLGLAQLGPLLLFALVGGLLADIFDRRRLLITVTVLQAMLSLVLAWVARVDDPSLAALVVIVFFIGVGQAVFGPTYGALLPALVASLLPEITAFPLHGAIALERADDGVWRERWRSA